VGASTAQVGGGKRGLETRKQVAWNEHRMKAFFSVYSMSQQYCPYPESPPHSLLSCGFFQ
jgi:hypothetical protein